MISLMRLADIQVSPSDLKIPQGDLSTNNVQHALSIAFGIGGGLALLIIVIAGLRFITSQGDPQAVTRARNTIIYALVGLVVCAIGYSFVTFVLGKL